ncbi:MAG: hybrid sensor histidine kinase/response regulator [Ignavibacteriaceae bacterium]
MNTNDEEFLKRLQATFRLEAEEHIRKFTSGLIELEKAPHSESTHQLIEDIFRETHSLKGAARSVGVKDVESVCQALENIFGKLQKDEISLTAAQFDLIHKAVDNILKMVSGTGVLTPQKKREFILKLRSITGEDQDIKMSGEQTLSSIISSEEAADPDPPVNNVPASGGLLIEESSMYKDTVRISIAKLDTIFLQSEQMIQSKINASQRITKLKNISDSINSWQTMLRKLNSRSSDVSILQFNEINIGNSDKLNELETSIVDITKAFENDQLSLERMIDDHLDSMKSVLMLPVSLIIEGFPKFVRDLASSQNKEVELIIYGKEIEIDKRVMEEMKVPLIHLIRNCIDHGIKNTSEREKLHKPTTGKITLSFKATESRQLEITISDDGAGIDLDKVRTAALKEGTISKESLEKLSTKETLMLIFRSGVSTSQMITDISGRGLGLAIVREKVEKLGGSVSVEYQTNVGTSFRILLPLTLSTSRCVLLRTGEYLFAVPSMNVERALRISSQEMMTIENKKTLMIDGKLIVTDNLGNVLGLENRNNNDLFKKHDSDEHPDFIQLLILVYADKRIAFIVDEILEESQILVKELGKQLSRVRNISGATVLGSGKVVPVINVSDLMKSAMRSRGSIIESKENITEHTKSYRILVTDDSITSRTLIKNIVESAGYIVETAVDGMDAFTKALVGEYDLIVSDVDMPRISGFELTSKIRKDKKLSELPVVLITALESKDDREHGIDVGANAYLVKSSFEQSNLLEVIKKLL